MNVSTIAIRPIWKLESRLFWLGLMSVTRPEVACSVLLQEQVRLAQRRDPRCLADVLDPECRVVLGLAREQRLAQGVARLTGLAVRPAVGDRRPVRVPMEDGNAVVLVAAEVAAVRRTVERAELALIRAGQGVAGEAAVPLAARVVVHRVARQGARRGRAGNRRRDDPLREAERGRQLEVTRQ